MIRQSSQSHSRGDRNFILWTLVPFVATWSGEKLIDDRITFDEVATLRPDGGHNIIHASVMPNMTNLPSDYVCMNNWCGPMWNSFDKNINPDSDILSVFFIKKANESYLDSTIAENE